jgi:hypothetical protein
MMNGQQNIKCDPCQYSETNVMHILSSLLGIKGFYMVRALLAHPQEVPYKALGILRACYDSWLYQDWSGTPILVQSTDVTRTQYTKFRLCSAS